MEREFWTAHLGIYANVNSCVTAILALLYCACIDEPNTVGSQEKSMEIALSSLPSCLENLWMAPS